MVSALRHHSKLQPRGTHRVMPSFRYGFVQATWQPQEQLLSQPLIFPTMEGVGGGSAIQMASFKSLSKQAALADHLRRAWMLGFRGERPHALINLWGSSPIDSGLLVVIPKQAVVTEPIRLVCGPIAPGLNVTHIVVVVEEGASVQLIEEKVQKDRTTRKLGGAYFSVNVVEVIAEPRSNVQWMVDAFGPSGLRSMAFRRAVIQAEAHLTWAVLGKGGSAQKWDTKIDLRGPGATVDLRQAIVATSNQEFDCSTRILHRAKETRSRFWTKAVLSDHAKVIVQGWILAKKKAARMSAVQQEDGLLLNDGVEFDPIPNLEIEQNDVECSHGVTVSQIDDELLFYLQSRGLQDRQGRSEIVKGFLSPVLMKDLWVDSVELRKLAELFIQQWE